MRDFRTFELNESATIKHFTQLNSDQTSHLQTFLDVRNAFLDLQQTFNLILDYHQKLKPLMNPWVV